MCGCVAGGVGVSGGSEEEEVGACVRWYLV